MTCVKSADDQCYYRLLLSEKHRFVRGCRMHARKDYQAQIAVLIYSARARM